MQRITQQKSTHNSIGLRPLRLSFSSEIMGASSIRPWYTAGWQHTQKTQQSDRVISCNNHLAANPPAHDTTRPLQNAAHRDPWVGHPCATHDGMHRQVLTDKSTACGLFTQVSAVSCCNPPTLLVGKYLCMSCIHAKSCHAKALAVQSTALPSLDHCPVYDLPPVTKYHLLCHALHS